MKSIGRLLGAAALALLIVSLAAACADEAAAPEDGTGSDGNGPAPQLRPELSQGVDRVGQNSLNFSLGAGISYRLDPYRVPLGPEEVRPECDAFVFAFAWRIIEPAEPPADLALVWQHSGSGAPAEIGRGAAGTQTVGCGELTALNQTDGDVIVEVDYIVGSSGG